MATDPVDESLAAAHLRDQACDAFEKAWLAGDRPSLADAVRAVAEADRAELFAELVRLEVHYRRRGGEKPGPTEYAARFPEFAAAIEAAFSATTPFHPAPEPPRTLGRFSAGDVVAGRYRIVARVGAGGMGEVYRADDLDLGGPVALKFLPTARTADPEWVARLKQEVAVARRVTHENVCRVHDLGDAAGQPFLVMEYVDGRSLADLRRIVRRLDPEQLTNYARQLCDGLAAVHDRGLLHRDLKPANVLIDHDGRLLLADFGLAAAEADVGADEAGAGTVAYMAPEQLTAAGVSVRSDLFALGLILFELATGERPFPGTTRAELVRQYAAGSPRPSSLAPGLDPALDAVVARCLDVDPQRRPASAAEVKAALPPLSPRKTADRGGSGRLRPAVAVALLAGVLAALFLHAWAAPRTAAYHHAGQIDAPDALRQKAAQLLRDFGYDLKTVAAAGSFEWDVDLIRNSASGSKEKATGKWPDHEAPGTPPLYYWYRTSPRPLAPSYRVTPADPPLSTSGGACVLLDPQGRLLEFHSVPDRLAPGERRPAGAGEWATQLLTAAGLDPAVFPTRLPVDHRPPVFADDTWTAKAADGSGVRVDAALCDGRPVYFRVSQPFHPFQPDPNHPSKTTERKDRVEGEAVVGQMYRQSQYGKVGLVVWLTAMVLGVPMAARNIRLGRCDLPAAARLGGVWAVCSVGGWVLSGYHSFDLVAERAGLMSVLGATAFMGLTLLVLYLTLEPQMRRRWPERLTSWNRLLGGRFGDPLVGRDVLVGVAVGVALAAAPKVAAAVAGTAALYAPMYEPYTPDRPAGVMVLLAGASLVKAVYVFALVVLFGLLLRRESLALAALAALVAVNSGLTQITFGPTSWEGWAAALAAGGLVTSAVARFGLVTLVVAHFTDAVLEVMPITLEPERWYASTAALAAGAIVSLSLYGFVVSLGGQRLIPDEF